MPTPIIFQDLDIETSTFSEDFVEHSLSIEEIDEGLTNFDDWMVYRNGQHLRVYDRICDHNGGRLISNMGKVSCPMHGWQLDPATGRYNNVGCEKKPLVAVDLEQHEGPVSFRLRAMSRDLVGFSSLLPVEVEFLNHACVVVRSGDISFATDPWLVGPAFSNGWWLARSSVRDCFDRVNACDFVYISHNHPDHLHPETLQYIRKDMPILTPAFSTGSTVRYMRELGFETIIEAGFDQRFVDRDRELAFSVVKSGDFRDDSGLLVEIGAFSGLFAVDSNFVDFHRFPKGLTLLASAFAGGASGFPLCFNDYDENEKMRILARNRNVLKHLNGNILKHAQPKAFMPYAGFFKEKAPRDTYVSNANKKLSPSSYAADCEEHGVALLDVLQDDQYHFVGNELTARDSLTVERWPEPDISKYIEETDLSFGETDREAVEAYFMRSGFTQSFDLLMRLTDHEFQSGELAFYCRFTPEGPVSFEWMTEQEFQLRLETMPRYLAIEVRQAEFNRVVALGLPWEDLSIGFQCRVTRRPNIYNADFWFHFTNVYVNDKVQRESLACDACVRLQHLLAV